MIRRSPTVVAAIGMLLVVVLTHLASSSNAEGSGLLRRRACPPTCCPLYTSPNRSATSAQEYVWYVSYGSNLRKQRFDCYIKGGKPENSDKTEEGCKDKSPPCRIEKVSIPYQLYFAEEKTKAWKNGGVAFIGHDETPTTPTIGRMYLITEEQFKDVVKQENGIPVASELNLFDLREVKAKTRVTFLYGKSNWYGTIVYLGDKDGYPKYSFTASREYGNYNAPSEMYLTTIARGLGELGDMSAQEIAEYLVKARGVSQKYNVEAIKALYQSK